MTCNRSIRIFTWLYAMFLIVSAGYSPLRAQIANGGFESSTFAPHYQQAEPTFFPQTFATSWYPPTIGSPDLISDNSLTCGAQTDFNYANPDHASCYPQVCVSTNLFGFQYPRTHTNDPVWGNQANHNYVGFEAGREYIQTVLPTMAAGACYTLTFWVSRGDMAPDAVKMQALLSHDNLVNTSYNGPMDASIYGTDQYAYVLTTADYIYNKQGWTKVQFSFKATGHEVYLTLGLFDKNGYTDASGNYVPTSINDLSTPGDCGENGSSNPCGPEMPNTTNNTHCQAANIDYYYIDDVSLAQLSGAFTPDFAYTNATIGTFAYSNKTIIITGNCTISGNVSLTNCEVYFNNGASLTVPFGSQLHILGTSNYSVLHAGCDLMWLGVIVYGQIEVKHSKIQDAIAGLTLQSNCSWQIENDCYFERNVTDIVVNGNTPIISNFIRGSTFNHTIPLLDPTQNIYGMNSIVVNGSGVMVGVGGNYTAAECYFLGGQSGIKSTNANVHAERCFFTGMQQLGIEFIGNPMSTDIRALTVISCAFTANKEHILSHYQTDLTVQRSSFANATQHAIEWNDNYDCHLLIGDPANAQNGNSFINNAWTAVTAWGNHTSQTNPTTLSTNDNGQHAYTDIVIANNQITAPAYGAGILIGEWTLGQYVSYHSLDISSNTIFNTIKGISLFNVKGWGGVFNTQLTTLPVQQVKSNMIYTTTLQTTDPYALRVGNAPGFLYYQNGVSSNNTGNYQNSGLRYENAEFSDIYGNIISAGTCIISSADMFRSNIHCNTLANYACGINLAYTYLRSGSTDLHGSSQEEYNNVTNVGIPWNADLVVYNSDVDHNKWVWNNATSLLTILYAGNTGSGSVISSVTGTDKCMGPFGSPIYVASGTNAALSFPNDATAQWRADYDYEIQRRLTGNGDSTHVSANIKAVIDIENEINTGEYAAALSKLAALSPSNNIEQNYKTVLSIFANVNYPASRDATGGEIASLIAIAQQHARTAGAAVTLARAFLAVKDNMYFPDEDYADGEASGVATIKNPCSLSPESHTTLDFMDADGNALGFEGAVVTSTGSFNFDPYQLSYYNSQSRGASYRMYAKYGSQYTVVNKDFHTLADWISASPIYIDLSGVAVLLDTVSTQEYMSIPTYTSMSDANGNVYSVGTTTGSSNTDFLIEKRNEKGDLLWSRTYDGPVSGDDMATCMYLDAEGSVYVAGKVWNGSSYDSQAQKYDTDGDLVWTSMLADPDARDNTPTGITLDENDGTVHIIGTCDNDYRYVHYGQCLPDNGRYGYTVQEDQTSDAPPASVSLYPNPSNGSLMIDLNGQSGGVLDFFDLEGQLVYTKQINQSGDIHLPENLIRDGVYLVKFTTPAGAPQMNKLIIQRNK